MGLRREMHQGDLNDFNPRVTYDSGPLKGQPVDFDTADTITATAIQGGEVLFSGVAVTGDDDGYLVMEWPAGSTDVVGEIQVQVTVTWGGKPVTLPTGGSGHFAVNILPTYGF